MRYINLRLTYFTYDADTEMFKRIFTVIYEIGAICDQFRKNACSAWKVMSCVSGCLRSKSALLVSLFLSTGCSNYSRPAALVVAFPVAFYNYNCLRQEVMYLPLLICTSPG